MTHIYKRKLEFDTGTEGPSFDPYGYIEYIVHQNEDTISLHLGLKCFLDVNDKRIESHNEDKLVEKFTKITGFSIYRFHRTIQKMVSKCRDCGCKKFEYMSGYPGEHFLVCRNCRNVIDYHFNVNKII